MNLDILFFNDVVRFIDKDVKIATHPLYGKQVFTGANKQESTSQKISCNLIKKENSQMKETKCSYCKKDHYFTKCGEFDKIPIKDKITFVSENGMCFSCLKIGHKSKFCKFKLKCFTCNRKHPTTLHAYYKDRDNQNSSSEASAPSNSAIGQEPASSNLSPVEYKVNSSKVLTNDNHAAKMSVLPL